MQKLKRNDSGVWVLVATSCDFSHPDANICCTGVGKINAAIAARHIIDTENPRLILSLGSVSSGAFEFGQIINPTGWVQRDMNLCEFLGPKYVTPMSGDEQIIKYGMRDDKYPNAVCGSGDTWIKDMSEEIWNCVDIDGFAIAVVCRAADVPFISYKFVTDGKSCKVSPDEWSELADQSRESLHWIYDEIMDDEDE
ncbi:MAG: hypothetical protein FWE52_00810 [Alphaproteobacteria bacterium]|nr:hypothetical protein [Alphaproteobacteria bacterium]